MRGDQNICAVARIAIHEGQEEAFRALAEEMSVATAKEPGTLTYQWYLAEDCKTCRILERYADSDAVRAHLDTFGAFGERMLAISDITSLKIHGNPDDELRKAIAQFSPKYYTPFAGFVR